MGVLKAPGGGGGICVTLVKGSGRHGSWGPLREELWGT